MKRKGLASIILLFLMSLLTACESKRAVDINMDDVKNTLVSCALQIIVILAAIIVVIIVSVAVRKINAAKKKLIRGEAVIAGLLVIIICINTILFGPVYSLMNLVFGEQHLLTEESAQSGEALTEEIAGEGIVLLENQDNFLPLTDNTTNLNVFGWASTDPVYGGTGSGAVDTSNCVTLLQGLENAGYSLNTELSDFYTDYHVGRPLSSWAGTSDWTLSEPATGDYTDEIIANAKSFSDTALVVLARIGGENVDLPRDMSTVTYNTEEGNGHVGDFQAGEHYLQLSQTEEDLIETVCSNFTNVIVVLNSANPMEMGWILDYSQIKSVLWCAGPGETGFNALGSILSGEVNPSGRLVDTFLYDLTATPIYNNYGNLVYENSAEFTSSEKAATFVNYVEGIYVGYKFYETAAAEGLIDYDATVQYPFGYGLSYTSFEQEISNMKDDGTNITIDVTVTNTGSIAGKDVVEVYYNPPYYDGGIEKSTANLIDFEKTSLLEPGASETVSVSFSYADMASFDYLNYGCYVLEHGTYEISIGKDSHNLLDTKTVSVQEDVIYDESHDGSREDDTIAATAILQEAQGEVTYLSRADGFANYEEATASPSMVLDEKYLEAAAYTLNPDPTVLDDETDVMPVTGEKNGLKITDLVGLEYDDAQWDLLLNQLKVEEMNTLIAYGGYSTAAISSIGLPATVECDGPQSIYSNYVQNVRGTAFTSSIMLAATWNKELANAKGELMGRQADEMNISGWYGPALNIHRSAFSGRNFEYYSEDAVISGKMAAQEILGANEHGLLTYMKHFAINDQETNRQAIFTWLNEQSAREIYLKAFEIAAKEGESSACMTAYNLIGTEWTAASSDLCTTILREEWGFQGIIVTDWFNGGGYQNADLVIRGGSDKILSLTGNAAEITDMSATSVNAMRNATHNILYAIANSRTGVNIDESLQAWEIVIIVINVILGLLLIAAEGLLIRRYIIRKRGEANVIHVE